MHHYSSFPLRNTSNIKPACEPRHPGEMLQSPSPSGLGSHVWKPVITTLLIFRRMPSITLLCHFDSTDGFHELPSR